MMTHPSQEAQKLEPCPFCGGAPKVVERPDTGTDHPFVCFIACHCGGYSSTAHQMGGGETQAEASANAAAAWNRRALLRSQQPVSGGDWLEEQDFYDAMQGYRCAPREDQREVMAHFEHVKRFIRARLSAPQAVADDEVIALAEALEVRRILEAIKAVAAIHPAADMPTPYQSAWQGACEEIFYQATGCQWHMDEDANRFNRVTAPPTQQGDSNG